MALPFETATATADPRAEFLAQKAVGNRFFTSLLEQYEARGDLSPKQWAIVDREIDLADRAGPARLAKVKGALADMVERFKLAGEHVKRPALILTDEDGAVETRFTPAPATGQNAGMIYVKRYGHTDWGYGWAYIAKINPATGQLTPARDYEDGNRLCSEIVSMLSDGLNAAVLHYGHATNNCGCCGRQLTEELSVKSGIGPICAERYNIDRTALIVA